MANIIKAQNEITLARVLDGEAGSLTVRYAPTNITSENDMTTAPNQYTKYLGILKENGDITIKADYDWTLIKGNDGQPGQDGKDAEAIYATCNTWQNNENKIATIEKDLQTLENGTTVTVNFKYGNICSQDKLTLALVYIDEHSEARIITPDPAPSIHIFDDEENAVYDWENNSQVSLIYITDGNTSYWQVLNNWALSKISNMVETLDGLMEFRNTVTPGEPSIFAALTEEQKANYDAKETYYTKEDEAYEEKLINLNKFYWDRKELYVAIEYFQITNESFGPNIDYYRRVLQDEEYIYFDRNDVTELNYNSLVNSEEGLFSYRIINPQTISDDTIFMNVDIGDSFVDNVPYSFGNDNESINLFLEDDIIPTNDSSEFIPDIDIPDYMVDISYAIDENNFDEYKNKELYKKVNDNIVLVPSDDTYSNIHYYLKRHCYYWWQYYQDSHTLYVSKNNEWIEVDKGWTYNSDIHYFTYTPPNYEVFVGPEEEWWRRVNEFYLPLEYDHDWTLINGSKIYSGTISLGGQGGKAGELIVNGGYFNLSKYNIPYDEGYKYVEYNSAKGEYETITFDNEEEYDSYYYNIKSIEEQSDWETLISQGLYKETNEGYIKVEIGERYDSDTKYYTLNKNFYLNKTNDVIASLTEAGIELTWGRFDINNGTFEVDYDGNLIATSAQISGTVEANSGYFQNVEIIDNVKIYHYDEDGKVSNNYIVLGNGAIRSSNNTDINPNQGFYIKSDGSIFADNITLGSNATIFDYMCIGDLEYELIDSADINDSNFSKYIAKGIYTKDKNKYNLVPNDANYSSRTEYYSRIKESFIYNPTKHNNNFITTSNFNLTSTGIMTLGSLEFNGKESHISGDNWNIYSDYAEFNNANITGKLSTTVFEKSKVNLVGGTMLFKTAEPISSLEPIPENIETKVFLKEKEAINNFNPDSYVVFQEQDPFVSDNINLKNTYSIYKIKERTEEYLIIYGICDSYKEGDFLIEVNSETSKSNPIQEWFIGINSTNSNRGFNLYKNSITFSEPTLRTIDENNTNIGIDENDNILYGELSLSPTIVLGELDSNILKKYGKGSGQKGLFAKNVVLTGQLTTVINESDDSKYAGINSDTGVSFDQSLTDDKIEDSSNIMFWGGASPIYDENGTLNKAIQSSPFQVTTDGTLYSQQAYIKGAIIADSILSTSVIQTPWIDGIGSKINEPALKITNTGIGILFQHGSYEEHEEPDDLIDIFKISSGWKTINDEIVKTGKLELLKENEYQILTSLDNNKFILLKEQLYEKNNNVYTLTTDNSWNSNKEYYIKNNKTIFSIDEDTLNYRKQFLCKDGEINIVNSNINFGSWSVNENSGEAENFNKEWEIINSSNSFNIFQGNSSIIELTNLSTGKNIIMKSLTNFKNDIKVDADVILKNNSEISYGDGIQIIPHSYKNNNNVEIYEGYDLYII